MKTATTYLLFSVTAGLGAILDILSKWLTFARIGLHERIDLITGVLAFHCVDNRGIVWGTFQESGGLFVVVAAVAVPFIALMHHYAKPYSRFKSLALGLLLAGAIGNLFDRLVHGYVRDFIDFYVIGWPVFNLADAFICVGVTIFAITMIRDSAGQKEAPKETAPQKDR